MTGKARPCRAFLARNPFECPWTLGFFYREKMRAIWRVAPDLPFERILEVGGGRSGLTRLLYPDAAITNLDMEPAYADAPPNLDSNVLFVVGDAARLRFEDGSFDAVTMFDLLEHVPDDGAAVSEALRVLRDGGWLLISTPNESWRFPYYRPFARWCPTEQEMFDEWGHVRRGYAVSDLERLIGLPCLDRATFITPVTAMAHDVGFSRLPRHVRRLVCGALLPVTYAAYALHRPDGPGTETVSVWRKPPRP